MGKKSVMVPMPPRTELMLRDSASYAANEDAKAFDRKIEDAQKDWLQGKGIK